MPFIIFNFYSNIYSRIFNFTKDEWKKINASGAYEALINGIQEAKKNVEEYREILKKVTKLMNPADSDNIIDKTNLAHAYSDRLKQRIHNLKDISKSKIAIGGLIVYSEFTNFRCGGNKK